MSLIRRCLLIVVFVSLAAGPVRADDFLKVADINIGNQNICGIAFSPDGKSVVVAGSRGGAGSVEVWNVAERKRVADFKGHEPGVWAVAFSPDGKRIASGGEDATARVWDVASQKEIAQIAEFSGRVTAVAFSPDSKTLLVGCNDSQALLYDIATKKVTFPLKGHTESVRGVAFAPDGKTCATVGKDKQALIWNAETGKLLRGLRFPDIFYSVTFTPDSKKLIMAGGGEFRGDHAIKMVDLTEKKGKALQFKGHTDSVWALSITADGKTLASCGYHDLTARVWNVATQTEKAVLKLGTEVFSVAISPDGRFVAATTNNGIALWEAKQ